MAAVGISSGCGSRADADAAGYTVYRPVMAELPPPASDRIDYDDSTRTLTFYDLPASGRWMVWADGGEAVPAGPDFRIPEGADADGTEVYYCRPGGQTSAVVYVADIRAARQMHASQGQ